MGLLAIAGITTLAGLSGGLARLGWSVPLGAELAGLHGPLMISGLFGTLIGLERAVALDRGWAYGAPACAALGAILLLPGLPLALGAGAFVVAATILCAASFVVAREQPMLFNGTLLLGSLAWLAGNVLWLSGWSVPEIMGWWLAFPILTITGERLELSRVMTPKRGSEALFLLAVILLLVGAQNALQTENGARLFGLAAIAMTIWLLRFDIARRNIRRSGETRFFAACMLAAYFWLAIAGMTLVYLPAEAAAYRYDMALHAVLIGFVLSMVFGHALIILPAVLRLRVRYGPLMYLPLGLLHAALAARMLGGLTEHDAIRIWSGPALLVALVAFVALVAHGTGKPAAPRARALPSEAGRAHDCRARSAGQKSCSDCALAGAAYRRTE